MKVVPCMLCLCISEHKQCVIPLPLPPPCICVGYLVIWTVHPAQLDYFTNGLRIAMYKFNSAKHPYLPSLTCLYMYCGIPYASGHTETLVTSLLEVCFSTMPLNPSHACAVPYVCTSSSLTSQFMNHMPRK